LPKTDQQVTVEIEEQEYESPAEDEFSDWETINTSDYPDLPPPNVITDPFKQKWKDLKSAYKGISTHK
jgi:hypothetical protein